MKKMKKEIEVIDKIVNYWVGFLEKPETSKFNNGDLETGDMANFLMGLLKKEKNTDEEISNFKNGLLDRITNEKPRCISVDYQPTEILDSMGVKYLSNYNSMSTFPCKTNMYIDWDSYKVEVSEGYGALEVEL